MLMLKLKLILMAYDDLVNQFSIDFFFFFFGPLSIVFSFLFCWLLHCSFVSFFWLLHCIGGAPLPEGSSITLLHIDFSPPWKTAWIEELTFEIESKLNFNKNFITLGLVLG